MTVSSVRLANVQVKAIPQSTAFRADELAVVERLRSEGIYAMPGVLTEYRYVDVVAFGCVAIEVRTSNGLKARPGYHWRVEPTRHSRGIQGDVVILVTNTEGERRYYVFPVDHPVFMIDGRLKAGMKWTPGGGAGGFGVAHDVYSLSDDLMHRHENAWHYIQEKLTLISECLRDGTYEQQRMVELPESEVKEPELQFPVQLALL